MRRIVAVAASLVLLVACARTGQPQDTIRPDTSTPASAGPAVDVELTCEVFFRSAVTAQLDQGEVVTLVADGDVARVERDPLTFEAAYTDDEFDGRSVSIRITEGDRAVMSHLLQMARDRAPENQFVGGHGFSGLLYAYSAEGAEMQYWCQARPLRDQ
jgi:hypothetical protein